MSNTQPTTQSATTQSATTQSTTTVPAATTPVKQASLRRGLLVLAVLLAGLVVLRSGRVGPEPAALAEMTASSGSYTAMTTRSGAQELLFVVDDRSETLMVYRVNNARQVDLMDRQSLPQMFTAARAAWLGTQPARTRP